MNQRTLLVSIVFLLAISAVSAIQITSQPVTDATVNQQYAYQVQTDAQSASYALIQQPSGMTISSNGQITWTPTQSGIYDVTVNATNASNTSDQTTQAYQLTVSDPAPGSFQANTLDLGGSDTERDQTYQTTYTVQNTGDRAINNFSATPSNVNNEYELSLSPIRNFIPADGSTDVSVSYYVPEDADTDRTRIGTVELSGNSDDTSPRLTRDITLAAQNGLNIDEVEVNGDGVDSGDEIDEELDIGDDVEVVTTMENVLDDIDIEDVELETTSDFDPADNLGDDVDIDAGDEEDLEVSFTIEPNEVDVEDAPYEVEMDFEGEDENGAEHTESFNFEFDLDVDDEDLRIVDTFGSSNSIQTNTLRCGETSTQYSFDVRNVGEDDLEDATVGFDSNELDIDRLLPTFEIDTGDSERIEQRFTFQERPDTGTYYIDVNVYPDRGDSSTSDSDTLILEVPDCTSSGDGDDDEDDGQTDGGQDNDDGSNIDVGQEPNQGQAGPVGEPVVIGSGQDQTISDREYVYILAGLVAILIITTGWMLGRALS